MPAREELPQVRSFAPDPARTACCARLARLLLAAAALVPYLTPGFAAPAAPAAPAGGAAGGDPSPPQFSRHVLENGLTVLLAEEHTLPLVSLLSWYRSGARYESPGITGIAHYLEHMAFRDAENIPHGDVTGLIERLGGHWHGYTRLDNTTYYETARREALDWLLFLEAQRMQNSRILPDEVEVERGSVLSELKGYENDPWSLLFDDAAAIAFREHPYRYNIVGWVSDLEAITQRDIVDFYHRHYVPANSVLTIVGDFDTEHALSAVRQAFASVPARPAPEPLRTREPPQRGEKRVTLALPSSSPHVLIAHHAPASGDPDFHVFLLLDGLLSGGRSLSLLDDGFVMGPLSAERRTSRLYREVVKTGLASRLTTGLLPSLHPYLYTITAEAAPGVAPERLEGAILACLERLSSSELEPEELERVRERLGNLMRLETDTYQEVAHVRAAYEALGAPTDWGRFEERLAQVTPEHIQRVARRIFVERNRTVGTFIPEATPGDGEATDPPETARTAGAAVDPAAGGGAPAQPEGGKRRGRLRAPGIKLSGMPLPPAFSERRLESGLLLLAARNPWVPTASLAAEIEAGPAFDLPAQGGVAALTARLLAFGSTALGTEETAATIDRLGMRWNVRVGGDDIDFPDPRKVRIEIEFAARDAERAAALLAGALRGPAFPRAEVRNARQAQISAAAALEDDAVGLAWNRLWSALYAETSWGRALPASGHEEALASMRAADLTSFHERYYRPERTRIAFCGGLREAQILSLLERAFGDWSPSAADADGFRTARAGSEQAPGEKQLLERIPSSPPLARLDHKTQVEMAYGFFTGIERSAPEYPLFEALWYVVQHGYYAGRLGNRVVSQRGLAYSLHSHHAPELPGSPMFMATGAPPEKVDELKRLWDETLDEIGREGITNDELAAARTYLEGRRLHERESNLSAARAALRGGGAAPEAAQPLTLERVNQLARRLLLDRRAAWSLAGPGR